MKGLTGVLTDHSYRLFLTARALSVAGYAVTAIALPLLMFELTESALLFFFISVRSSRQRPGVRAIRCGIR